MTILAVKYAIMMVMQQRGVSDADSSMVKLLRTLPVYFVLCPDSTSAQRKRWELDSTTAVLADERLLVGFNLILGVAEVADSLGTPSRPASHEDVAAWLSKAKQKSMSVEVVKSFLRIRKRFTPEAVVSRRFQEGWKTKRRQKIISTPTQPHTHTHTDIYRHMPGHSRDHTHRHTHTQTHTRAHTHTHDTRTNARLRACPQKGTKRTHTQTHRGKACRQTCAPTHVHNH